MSESSLADFTNVTLVNEDTEAKGSKVTDDEEDDGQMSGMFPTSHIYSLCLKLFCEA